MKRSVLWPLDRACSLFGDSTGTIDRGEHHTYAEVTDRVLGLAGGLLRLGLAPGDVVGVLMENSREHLETWFAIPGAGLVLNDLNHRLAVTELEFIVNDCGMKALIVDRRFFDLAEQLRAACPRLVHLIPTGRPSGPVDVSFDELTAERAGRLPDVDENQLAAIFYTGGTTGLPKGVMLSHANLLHNALHMHGCLALQRDDRYLHAAPMFHLADGSLTYALTWAGGSHAFVPAFEPGRVCETIERDRVTLAMLVPTMITMIVSAPETATADFSSLRALCYGGSPMPEPVQQQAMAMLGCSLHQFYGTTEAAPVIAHLPAEDHVRGLTGDPAAATRLRSAGRPIMGVRMEIRRADGVTRCPAREPGEIFVQGPNIMLGYWNRPEETAAVLDPNGWYRTGDVGYVDEQGYLFIEDRAKDMIISGGENVYSAEVERVLYQHPALLEVAVIGIPHAKWGESVHAVVTLKAGAAADEAELVTFARERIADFKAPRTVSIHTEPLPKSGAGKILKRQLRSLYWQGQRQVH